MEREDISYLMCRSIEPKEGRELELTSSPWKFHPSLIVNNECYLMQYEIMCNKTVAVLA